MSKRLEELDWRQTPMGELVLRRRWDPTFGKQVHEIKLDDEYLMSSLFTVAEVELARRALARLNGPDLDVVVGGLGLGYTAQEVLAERRTALNNPLPAAPGPSFPLAALSEGPSTTRYEDLPLGMTRGERKPGSPDPSGGVIQCRLGCAR